MPRTIDARKPIFWAMREPAWRKRKVRSLKRHLLRHWESEFSIKRDYEAFFGRELALANPQTFSEKIFHRKAQA